MHSAATRDAPARSVDWERALLSVLDEPERVRPVFQPLVDLARGVVCGWEMLARFDHPLAAAPPEWFAAAARLGVAGRLEAVLVEAGLAARAALPANCFVTINVTPAALTTPEVRSALAGPRDLGGVVVEITEQAAVDDYEPIGRVLDDLRARGAAVAVDDAGAGYASLSHIVTLRPQFVKLDRGLVADLDRDEAKVAVIEAFGSFANRIDAWIVAEGVERTAELDVLLQLGVPLAQGYGLARPGPLLAGIDAGVAAHIRARGALGEGRERILALVERVAAVDAAAPPLAIAARFAGDTALTHLPVVDASGRRCASTPPRPPPRPPGAR
jgi:EAL domain-containing protein (putative c-di-GMP-specific phosphodiesterase class I)